MTLIKYQRPLLYVCNHPTTPEWCRSQGSIPWQGPYDFLNPVLETSPMKEQETIHLKSLLGILGRGAARLSGEDENGCQWIEFSMDPFAGDCECEGPECDPDTCPRFVTECSICGGLISSGWTCLSGGEDVCSDHVRYMATS